MAKKKVSGKKLSSKKPAISARKTRKPKARETVALTIDSALSAAGVSQITALVGSNILVSATGQGQFVTTVLVRTAKAAGRWSDQQVHPGPQPARVPAGELWQLDFLTRCMTASTVLHKVVEDPGTPEARTHINQQAGAAGQTVTWRMYILG